MKTATILAGWMADYLAANPVLHFVQSIADMDLHDPDKIAVCWEDFLVHPEAPPFHLHDLKYTVRLPTTCDLTKVEFQATIDFVRATFTAAAFSDLKARLLGEGLDLHDWFLGDFDTDSDRDNFRHQQDVRLAIVWL